MKVLNLTLYKRWFDEIKSGYKKIEYRDNKEYWRKRLFIEFPYRAKKFDVILFRNGYGKKSPSVTITHKNTFYNHALDKIEIILGDTIFDDASLTR